MKVTPEQILLAQQLLTSGLDFWARFSKKTTDGTLVAADLDEATLMLNTSIAEFEKNVEAGRGTATGT